MKYLSLKIVDLLKQNKIVTASLTLAVITCFVKLAGYAEKVLLAYYWGTGIDADAYNAVFAFIMSVFIFFREIVEPGFMNTFLQVRLDESEKASAQVFSTEARCLFPVGLVISLVIFLSAPSVTYLILPGFSGERFVLTAELMRISSFACVFLIASTLTYITLNAYKRFSIAAVSDLAFKGSIVVAIFLFSRPLGIRAAVFGLVIGALVRLGVHFVALRKYKLWQGVSFRYDYFVRIAKLTWPLLIGIFFSQLSSVVDNIFASYLQEGSISALSYAKKVVELPVVILPYALSVVIFPYFSELHIEKDTGRLFILLRKALLSIACVFIPLALVFFLFSDTITEIIFERGAFNAQSTLLTSTPLAVYALGMPAFAIETVLVVFYFSVADTRTPVFVGIGCVMLNILVTWIAVHYIGYVGIAGSLVISKTLKVFFLMYLLKYKFYLKVKK